MIEYTVKVYEDKTEWYLNGKKHRIDGPAIEWNNGTKEWWVNGKRHRSNGPAVEDNNGSKYWWVNGKKYTEEEFNKKAQKHTIVIDGNEIELSSESYENLKNSLI